MKIIAAIAATLCLLTTTACAGGSAESPVQQTVATKAIAATQTPAPTVVQTEAPATATTTVTTPTEAPPAAVATEVARLDAPAVSAASAPAGPPVVSGSWLTWDELDAAGAAAGWDQERWAQMRLIVYCETGGTLNPYAHNSADPNSGSYGLAQLNGRGHFDRAGENFEQRFDPVVNLRTALWLRNAIGRFGGTGGWYHCANRYGIY